MKSGKTTETKDKGQNFCCFVVCFVENEKTKPRIQTTHPRETNPPKEEKQKERILGPIAN
jgi:hypothetical protein